MSVALKKIPGVESVETSLNQGKAIVRLKPGNSIRFDDLIQRIRDNGFTPKEAAITVRGQVVSTSGKLQLKVPEVNQTYDIQVQPQAGVTSEEIRKHAGRTVLMEGLIPAPTKGKAAPLIQVKSIRESQG